MAKVVSAAMQEAASQSVEPAEVVRLSMADQACVANALLTPPPCPTMKHAFSRRRRLLRSE